MTAKKCTPDQLWEWLHENSPCEWETDVVESELLNNGSTDGTAGILDQYNDRQVKADIEFYTYYMEKI